MSDVTLIDEIAQANIFDQPATANLYEQPASMVLAQDDGTVVILVYAGPAGAKGDNAVTSMAIGAENAIAGLTVSMGFQLTDAFPATAASSKAYTSTPPATMPVTVQLLDNGVPFGNATWAVGANVGILSFNGPTAPFVVNDVPGFQLPTPLDGNFTQFTVNYRGP